MTTLQYLEIGILHFLLAKSPAHTCIGIFNNYGMEARPGKSLAPSVTKGCPNTTKSFDKKIKDDENNELVNYTYIVAWQFFFLGLVVYD